MRICFIGHVFHQRTRSSAFFIDLLKRLGPVTEFYADPDDGPMADDALVRTLLDSRFDRYVFWQSERIAERLLPLDLGLSFIVPMFDAVSHVPAVFWTKFVKYHFLSFSRAHHQMLQAAGCPTSYFQYYPEPAADHPKALGQGSREGFFWERHPRGAIERDLVLKQCGALGIAKLHLHAVPDFPDQRREIASGMINGVEVLASTWLEAPADFARLAGAPLFFFAPRPKEGIGMATLEAMGRGQIVVAPDLPTANEYLANEVSGLLYDPARPFDLTRLDTSALAEMSRAARRKIVEGRRMWLRDVERLLSIIADDGRRWATRDYSSHFATELRRSAHQRSNDAR